MADAGFGVLSRQEIEVLLDGSAPLLSNMRDRTEQLQPNGVDLTVESVSRFIGAGTVARSDTQRVLPVPQPLDRPPDGLYVLAPGSYQVRFNEGVHLPTWLMAYARPRSSLLRCGVALHTAVWDAGYSGRGVALMVVYNPAGFHLGQDARICQLVFHRLAIATESGYEGTFYGEGLQVTHQTSS